MAIASKAASTQIVTLKPQRFLPTKLLNSGSSWKQSATSTTQLDDSGKDLAVLDLLANPRTKPNNLSSESNPPS
jgi:hypothetical protein